MVLEINTKMNSMITKEEFQNKFEKLVTKSDLKKVVDKKGNYNGNDRTNG